MKTCPKARRNVQLAIPLDHALLVCHVDYLDRKRQFFVPVPVQFVACKRLTELGYLQLTSLGLIITDKGRRLVRLMERNNK